MIEDLMVRTRQDVTDAELAVLQALWDRGPANRRQLTDALYPGGGPAHYTTVQKLLQRLEAKGYVAKDRLEGVLTFVATVDKEQLISRRLQAVADKLCDGSLTPLLTTLIRAERLSGRQVQELRDLLDELRHPPKPQTRRR
jgi:predicted transcriptional regulator